MNNLSGNGSLQPCGGSNQATNQQAFQNSTCACGEPAEWLELCQGCWESYCSEQFWAMGDREMGWTDELAYLNSDGGLFPEEV
jgi:hypothetical protein